HAPFIMFYCSVLCTLVLFFSYPLSLLSTLFPYTTLFRSQCSICILCFHFIYALFIEHRFGECRKVRKSIRRIFRIIPKRLFIKHTPTLVMILDRKSTRLNSSHVSISYAVFCLKKKKKKDI